MLKTLVIEDEILARKTVKEILAEIPVVELIGEADSIAKSVALINKLNPDLLLLDIELKDGNSFEILKHFPNPKFQIIFITGFNQFAIKAFRHSAIDYLLKPVEEKLLKNAINKALNKKDFELNSQKIDLMLKSIQNNDFNKIAVSSIDGYELINKNEILYCESDGNYCDFYLSNGTKIISTNTLKKVQELLFENNFYRPHRSYILNINFVKKVVKTGFGSVIMQNNTELPISRRKKVEFLNLLGLQ